MITSRQNPRIQFIRTLMQKRRVREEENLIVIEGVRLIEEALDAGFTPKHSIFCETQLPRTQKLIDLLNNCSEQCDFVSPAVMEAITDTKTSQGVLAVISTPKLPLNTVFSLVLVLDNIRDPGNLGTMLRTAHAAKVDVVMLSPGSTDVFSPKVLRSAMGAHFHVPIIVADWDEISRLCKVEPKRPLEMLMAEPNQGTSCWQKDLTHPVALIIGSEADGPSILAQKTSDSSIFIPMPGGNESLNAAVAASILLFEIIRQRQS